MSGKSIRFEDLGEPVQKLFRTMNGGKGEEGLTEEDRALLEFVSVKDMAKIYQEMGSDRHAQQIWDELKAALQARRERAERKRREMEDRFRELDDETKAAEDDAERLRAEQEAAEAEAEKRRRKEERRRRRAAEAAAAAAEEEERQRLQEEADAADKAAAEEEEAAAAEEAERQRKREEKRRRKEEKARRLKEEQEALAQEQAAANEESKRRRKRDQKREWDDYVASHPLEFSNNANVKIDMEKKQHEYKPPPQFTDQLLSRTYTPQCPNCHAKYSKPPSEWDCPMCLRKFRQHIKCWQPDDVTKCAVCSTGVGRFTRHHCRNCGRVTCGKCTELKVLIPALGFKDAPVRACTQCMEQLAPAAVAAAQQK